MTKTKDYDRDRKHTFEELLKEYQEALDSGKLYPYQVRIYKNNIEYFKEVIASYE